MHSLLTSANSRRLATTVLTLWLVAISAPHAWSQEASAQANESEVVVYGGTPAGVMAAIAAARQGHTVVLIDLNAHVGGVVSGGLVSSDMGDRKTVGGLADDFFQRIVRYYTGKYGADSTQLK